MALGIDTVYQEYLHQVNKNQISGYANGDEFTRMSKRVELDWFNDQYKLYESSIKNTDDFRELKKTINLTLVGGVGTIPTDYYHFDKATYMYNSPQGNVQMRTLEDKTSSQEDFGFFEPSLKYPTIEIKGGAVYVNPTNIPMITLDYLRYPTGPVWGYTISGGREVYSAAASTDFEVPEYAFTDIVNRLVALTRDSNQNLQPLQYSVANENKS